MEKTYNGWTNYATWRVNLEIFDGIEPRDMDWHGMQLSGLANALKDYVDDFFEDVSNVIARDYARAFVSDVNWTEIAKHMMSDYADQWEEEEAA